MKALENKKIFELRLENEKLKDEKANLESRLKALEEKAIKV